MKTAVVSSLSIASLILLLYTSNAWQQITVPKFTTTTTKKTTTVSASLRKSAISIIAATTIIGTPLISTAMDIDFTGKYDDPKHPNCLREIVVPSGTTAATVTGTDGTPGCPVDGSGKKWKLMGSVDGDTILVDFSPKGGPANLKGEWDTTTTPAGIKWPDGNKWTIKNQENF